jgi:putative membrane protein
MVEWLKVLHIISVISWMAGLLYLPRLMVYHADKEPGSDASETFKIMEKRLMKAIMTPAMIASWVFGLLLVWQNDLWTQGWFITKLFLVLLLSAQHIFCVVWVKEFAQDKRNRNARFFRLVNEIPTVLMILVIILVEIQPF